MHDVSAAQQAAEKEVFFFFSKKGSCGSVFGEGVS